MKTVLITGATGALGSVTANAFNSAGWRVVRILSPRSTAPVDADTYIADLSDEIQVQAVTLRMKEDGLVPSAAVLIAGGFEGGGLAESEHAIVQRMMDMNFYSAWHIIRSVSQIFGSIHGFNFIAIGARAARDPKAGQSVMAYALSKSLLFSMAQILNADAESTGVRTTVLVPGTIDTPANRLWSPDADFSGWSKPEDMAKLMCSIAENDPGLEWKQFLEC